MQFKDLDIKHIYDSRQTDVYNEFFNTVLPHSNFYRRLGGIFSAKKFALFAEGLQDFIKENNGRMELAIIPIFSEDDKNALLHGIEVDDLITKNWISDLSQIKEKFLENHNKAIAWMIANDYLTIKIILPEHEDGTLLTESELKDQDIFRKEIGIMYNKEDNSIVSFQGIIDRENENLGELYQIDVFRDWIHSEIPRIESNHSDFSNFWDNEEYRLGTLKCKIIPLSKKLTEYFKQIAPKSKSEIPELKKIPVLRDYQIRAVEDWDKNSGRGIFEMATGTGKTITAIGCIKKIEAKNDKILVIIAAPYRNLIDQWEKELSKWFIDSTIMEEEWRQIIRDEVAHLNKSKGKKISVLIISHDLFSKDEFVKQIENCQVPTLLIVDEAHHAGTYNARRGLSPNYQYRLALSATIERWYDGDGTDFLRNYFSGPTGISTVASYSLAEAISDKKLCDYNYYPHFVELTEEEFTEYKILTYQAVRLMHSKDPEIRKQAENKIILRAKIIRDAANKIDAFKEILKEFSKIKHLLIFCSEKQYENVGEILSNLSKYCGIDTTINFRKITYEEPSNKKERIKILNDFADEEWDALLSNRVLDEGMDIPQARNCIVLASTQNPTQFIQRRGRVLRIYSDYYKDGTEKTHADIYDILVKPRLDGIVELDAIKLEIGMIRGQLSRIKDMSEIALNRKHCLEKIQEFTSDLPSDIFEND